MNHYLQKKIFEFLTIKKYIQGTIQKLEDFIKKKQKIGVILQTFHWSPSK